MLRFGRKLIRICHYYCVEFVIYIPHSIKQILREGNDPGSILLFVHWLCSCVWASARVMGRLGSDDAGRSADAYEMTTLACFLRQEDVRASCGGFMRCYPTRSWLYPASYFQFNIVNGDEDENGCRTVTNKFRNIRRPQWNPKVCGHTLCNRLFSRLRHRKFHTIWTRNHDAPALLLINHVRLPALPVIVRNLPTSCISSARLLFSQESSWSTASWLGGICGCRL